MMSVPAPLVYDPYEYEIDAHPHPVRKQLRDQAPLYRNDEHDFWAISRFQDVLDASLDWQTFSSTHGTVWPSIPTNERCSSRTRR